MKILFQEMERYFEVFTAATMKNAVFWDMAPCGFIRNLDGCYTFLRNSGLQYINTASHPRKDGRKYEQTTRFLFAVSMIPKTQI
jgi:hypothetical protein